MGKNNGKARKEWRRTRIKYNTDRPAKPDTFAATIWSPQERLLAAIFGKLPEEK